MKTNYYELMLMLRRDGVQEDTFENESEIANMALNDEIDSALMIVGNGICLICWLLRNDENIKGKYIIKKK